jgi:hypothetical protein
MGMILLRIGCGRRGVVVVSRRRPTISSHAIEELEDLTGAVEVQEVIRARQGIALRRGGVVGAAQGDGDMPSVREPDDEIRIVSATEADDLHSLATKRMMGMGDGDESRGRLG